MFFCCFLRFAICICTLILQFSLNYLTSGLACFFYLYIFTALHFLSRFHFICIFSLCRRNAKQICRFTLTDIIVSVDKHAYIHRMFNRYRHSYNYDIILLQRQLLPMHTQDLRSFYCMHIYDMQTIYLFI